MPKVTLTLEARIAKLQKNLTTTEKKMKNLGRQSNKTQKAMQKNFDKSGKVASKLTDQIKVLLTVGAAVQFTKAIINVRSEFEKYAAVLTNTLGSQLDAAEAMKQLQTFAAQTPFSLQQLTGAFVKLVNQGFKPTIEQMRKLGDLAASTGKDFDMLAEAIIDAQTGEFERLKEFGIRASKEGDKVTFTFKEVKTQVDFTASSIQDYILSLGDAVGVSGAMEAISETLGGKISNLGDAWEGLLNQLGGETSGVFTAVIGFLTDMSDKLTVMLETKNFSPTQEALIKWKEFSETLEELDKDVQTQKITEEILFLKDAILFARLEAEKWEKEKAGFFTDPERKQEVIAMRAVWDQAAQTHKEQVRIYTEMLDAINSGELIIESETDDVDDNTVAWDNRLKAIKKYVAYIKSLQDEEKRLETEEDEEIWAISQDFFTTWLNNRKAGREVDAADAEAHQARIDAIAKEGSDQSLADLEQAEKDKQAIREASFNLAHTLLNELSAVQNQQRQIQLEAAGEDAEKRERITREFARKEQKIAIGRALISGAEAILKIASVYAPPISTILQVLQGIQTAAQVAVIGSQKFARGGYEVLSGARHAQGGVRIPIGEAEGGEGHAVFSRKATQKYKSLLPGLIADINAGKIVASDEIKKGMPLSVNLDDSDQLEEIRKLLVKNKEVTFEKGYRVEKFNNVVSRIR